MKNKIIVTIMLLIFLAMALTIYLLYSQNLLYASKSEKYKIEIRNKSNDYQSKLDSINQSIKESLSKIDSLKQINDNEKIHGFIMDGRSISTEELLKTLNKTLEKNSVLESEVATNNKIFDILKKDYDVTIARENGKIHIQRATSIKKDENECVQKLKIVKNELDEKIFILKQLDNRYKLKYEVRTEGSTIKSTIYTSKVDSALWLYPYYKHKIKVDKNGDVFIK